MGIYSIVGWGGLPTTLHPLNTSSQDTQHSCKETSPPLLHTTHSNTQQHTTTHNNTTTLHNSTRVHKTTNVPAVFMALILNGFEDCNIITRGIGRGGHASKPPNHYIPRHKNNRDINSYLEFWKLQ
jgi:hypothetical protein